MIRFILTVCVLALGLAGLSAAQPKFETDVIPTAKGDLAITFLGHGSLMILFGGKTIHVDPWSRLADYAEAPEGRYRSPHARSPRSPRSGGAQARVRRRRTPCSSLTRECRLGGFRTAARS